MDQRAETLAEYLETVQWKTTFADLAPLTSRILGPVLDIQTGDITEAEVRRALNRIKCDWAPSDDHVPPELWTTLVYHSAAVKRLRELLQTIGYAKELPHSWKHASIVSIF